MRHAATSHAAFGQSDHDRDLTKEGIAEARLMSKKLINQNLLFDFFLTSSAVRAVSTCKIVSAQLGLAKQEIKILNDLYNCTIYDLKKNITLLSQDANTVAVFGHNPSMHIISESISNHRIPNFPTASMLCVDFDTNTWKNCFEVNKNILFLISPHNA